MTTENVSAAIDRIEHDGEFARRVYESADPLTSEFELTADEAADVRDPLVEALDARAGEVQGFVALNFGSIQIEYHPQSASPRDAASGLPTGKRMHKPYFVSLG